MRPATHGRSCATSSFETRSEWEDPHVARVWMSWRERDKERENWRSEIWTQNPKTDTEEI
jgi:hypothetical protein